MEIQRLSPDQSERFRAIRLASLRDAPEAFGSTLEETLARPPESWPKQVAELPTFIAVQRGADVGVVRGMHADSDPGAAFLISLWVAPEARGQGVGDALIDAVSDWARSEGFERLLLDVAHDNAPALALYARNGFRPTGETSILPFPSRVVGERRLALSLRTSC